MSGRDELASTTISRRCLLGAGGGTVLLIAIPMTAEPSAAAAGAATFVPDAFIRIDPTGVVTLIMPQVEMGQGVYTSISAILAEELDAAWATVRVDHAPPNEKLYVNPMLGVQATGNSNSIRGFWRPLRKAGAAARAVLVEAAAKRWGVSASACHTENSEVIHAESGRRIGYGALVASAAKLPLPMEPPLKDPRAFKLIGKPLKRLDTPDKVNGRVVYGIDALPAGVQFATLQQSPVRGGKVVRVEAAKAMAVPGVRQVVVLDDLMAVVGDHMWAAKSGLEALAPVWDDGPNGAVSSEQIWSQLRAASERDGAVAKNVGDASRVFSEGDAITQAYEEPLLAHATMEPLNCTVHVMPGRAEVWIGTQVMTRVQQAVAAATALPADHVTVHQHLLGGGFGRRLEPDMAFAAARIALHVEGPVKVVWTREEDVRHDIYRPAYRDVLSAKLADGRIVAWKHKVAGSAVVARWLPQAYTNDVDFDGVDSAVDQPYDIPVQRVEFVREEPPGIVTGFWRGVGPNNNVFAVESFIDELARHTGEDPLAFRRKHLTKTPRLLAALDLVAEKAMWGERLPPRCGRGVAVQPSFGSFIATVVEAEVDEAGEVRLRRISAAVDAGLIVNPDTVVAQLQGGLIFGLSAALYGEITLRKGRVQQSNFHDYRVMRMNQIPPIDVHLIRNGEPPGGIGETGTTAAIPALRNAIYSATGVALRRMPIDRRLLAAGSAA
jgi:isoquinoline 1-oxidoreductase beta subunit